MEGSWRVDFPTFGPFKVTWRLKFFVRSTGKQWLQPTEPVAASQTKMTIVFSMQCVITEDNQSSIWDGSSGRINFFRFCDVVWHFLHVLMWIHKIEEHSSKHDSKRGDGRMLEGGRMRSISSINDLWTSPMSWKMEIYDWSGSNLYWLLSAKSQQEFMTKQVCFHLLVFMCVISVWMEILGI